MGDCGFKVAGKFGRQDSACPPDSEGVVLDSYGKCPKCGCSWDGGDIPEGQRKNYSPPYKWSRLVGVEDPTVYDGVSWWRCPDCGAEWDRWAVTFKDVQRGFRTGPAAVKR
jgi:hypothetical protein